MSSLPKEVLAPSLLDQQNAKISLLLRSIADKGILPAALQESSSNRARTPLSSNDNKRESHLLCFNLLELEKQPTLYNAQADHHIAELLPGIGILTPQQGRSVDELNPEDLRQTKFNDPVKSNSIGCRKVSSERSYGLQKNKSKKSGQLELEDRLSQSVVFIFRAPAEDRYQSYPGLASYIDNSGRASIKSSFIIEGKTEQPLAPNDILAILGPHHLIPAVSEAFENTLIIPVGKTKVSIDLNNLIMSDDILNSDKYSIQEALEILSSREKGIYTEFTAADYHQALKEFFQTTGEIRFAMHLVRLPTVYDVQAYLTVSKITIPVGSPQHHHLMQHSDFHLHEAPQKDVNATHIAIYVIYKKEHLDLLSQIIKKWDAYSASLISPDDAATTLQEAFRGFSVRKAYEPIRDKFRQARELEQKVKRLDEEVSADITRLMSIG